MSESGYYPPGAELSKYAPWNQTEEQKEYEVIVETKYVVLADSYGDAELMWTSGDITDKHMTTETVLDIIEKG